MIQGNHIKADIYTGELPMSNIFPERCSNCNHASSPRGIDQKNNAGAWHWCTLHSKNVKYWQSCDDYKNRTIIPPGVFVNDVPKYRKK